ncbi:MAG: GDP-mannose 4,6-dehydratase [Acidimicrobiales bacterium]
MGSIEKALVTGVNGFIGRHMARYLLDSGIHVVGVGRAFSSTLKHPAFQYECCDLLQPDQVGRLLRTHQPAYVIHLAGAANVAESWVSPGECIAANMQGAFHLLDALYQLNHSRLQGVLIPGSAHEYHLSVSSSLRLTEESAVQPQTPYGYSKWLQTSLAGMYALLYKMPVVIARTFNLIGPGAKNGICAQFAQQIAAMECGQAPPQLRVGDIHVARDFVDVRDAVRAYWQLLIANPLPRGEVYNVCSGQTTPIATLLRLFQDQSRIPFVIAVDGQLCRSSEPYEMIGDNTKLCELTGWRPLIMIESSVQDVLEDARSRTQNPKQGGIVQ